MIESLGVEWRPSPYLVPTILAGLAATVLAAYAWRHRDKRGGLPFTALVVGLCIWSLGYGIQLGFTARGPMVLLDKIAFAGSVLAPTAWLVLAVEYAGYERWLSKRVLGVLAIEPLLTIGLVWTNGAHGLIWQEIGVDASGSLTILELSYGPAYWANLAYSYALVVGGIVLLASVVVRANRIHRRQSLVLLLGAAIPLGANAIFHLTPGLNPMPNLDLTPFAFAVTSVLFALALFRFRILDLVPVARDTLVERMDDGVVVLAADGTIVDLNPGAREVLGDAAIGLPIAETAIGDAEGAIEGYVSVDVDGESRSFDVSVMSISDFRGEEAGRFVLMRDITQLEILRVQEQRLSVLNRLLRHNIRNEINVITGRSELLADKLDGTADVHLAAINRATGRILSISDQARYIETTIAERNATPGGVDVAAVATLTVEAIDAEYPDATIEWGGPERALASGVDREQLRRALTALVENAIEHNPRPTPRVWVRVETTDATVRIAVADDGPGIPEMERAILERGQETPLEHGAGLGLWLVKWVVEAANGTIAFEGNDHDGSTVVVELPRAGASQTADQAR